MNSVIQLFKYLFDNFTAYNLNILGNSVFKINMFREIHTYLLIVKAAAFSILR